MTATEMTFGQRVRQMRILRGLSHTDLGDKIGISRGSVSNIEAGRHDPSVTTLVKLAEALDVPTDVLLGLEPFNEIHVVTVKAIRRYRASCETCGELGVFEQQANAEAIQESHLAEYPAGGA